MWGIPQEKCSSISRFRRNLSLSALIRQQNFPQHQQIVITMIQAEGAEIKMGQLKGYKSYMYQTNYFS
jgi:hypothetical protein